MDPVVPRLEGYTPLIAQAEKLLLGDRKDNVMILTGLLRVVQLLVVLDLECKAAQSEVILLRATLGASVV